MKRPTWTLTPQWEVYRERIHTTFKRTTSHDLAQTIKETVKEHDGKTMMIADAPRNDDFDLMAFYQELQNESFDTRIWAHTKRKENQLFAERADIGMTFSDITLAESGTVTLFHHKGNERSISLLPQTYIAIIPKETLVPRMTQATQQIHKVSERGHVTPSCISFISGPSNSADIEMNLIVGVHGPVKVTYIVIDD